MTVIVDYGVGNLFSLSCSLNAIGEEALISSDPQVIEGAERIILPGVGAFSDAMEKLRASGVVQALTRAAKRGVPILGICLGMQLLFEKSFEYGEHEGLGWIEGEVAPIPAKGLKIPHMGWNSLSFGEKKHPLFAALQEGDHVYFVHSYAGVNCDKYVIARTEYGGPVTAAVANGNVLGCQFHPEKSGEIGLCILKTFCSFKEGDL